MNPQRIPDAAVVLALALTSPACGDDSSGTGNASFGTMTQSSATAASSMSESADASATSAANSGTATDTGPADTGAGPDLGVCEDYIDCAMEAMPETPSVRIVAASSRQPEALST